MPRKTSPHTDDWAAAFGAALQTRERLPSGKGWKTSHELREELDVGRVKFYQVLRMMRQQGRIEQFTGRVSIAGKLSRCEWYRLR
jgi:hypothetical protein